MLSKLFPMVIEIYIDDKTLKRINSLIFDYEISRDETITKEMFCKNVIADFIENMAITSTEQTYEKLKLLNDNYKNKSCKNKITIFINNRSHDRLADLEDELLEDFEFDISIDDIASLLVIDFLSFVKKDKTIFYKLIEGCNYDD